LWTDISGNLPNIPVNDILVDPANANTLYAATDIGVFISTTAGTTWSSFNTGLPPVVISAFSAQSTGLIQLGSYGRGAYELRNTALPGVVSAGLYVPSSGTWFLRNSNSGGAADLSFFYGPSASTFKPLAGDWNGDRVDTPGLYDPATGSFFLRNTS